MPTQRLIPVQITAENKCSFCAGSKCCAYITHPLDTPRSIADFDYLLWQVSHAGIAAFRDADGWYLQVDASCSHLAADGRCGIYATRPMICREHSNDDCEFDGSTEDDFELYFDSAMALETYCRKRFKRWDRRFG